RRAGFSVARSTRRGRFSISLIAAASAAAALRARSRSSRSSSLTSDSNAGCTSRSLPVDSAVRSVLAAFLAAALVFLVDLVAAVLAVLAVLDSVLEICSATSGLPFVSDTSLVDRSEEHTSELQSRFDLV